MSYELLQGAVDSLKQDNRALTDRLIDSSGHAKQMQLDVSERREEAKTNRKAMEPMLAEAQAERDAAITARNGAQAQLPLAQAARDTAQAQPALAQTEVARSVAAANAKQLTALGSDDYLASVKGLVQPSLVLDFAKGEYWKQGKYPWNKVELDLAVDALPMPDYGVVILRSDEGTLSVGVGGNTLGSATEGITAISFSGLYGQELSFSRSDEESHDRIDVYPHSLSAAELEALTLPVEDIE